MTKSDIFNFNHTDQSKSKDQINEIKELYKYYHYKYWCYEKAYKYFKQLNLVVNMSSTGLIVLGTVLGGVTLHPAILGAVTGARLLVTTLSQTKDYKHKIEKSKHALKTYQKVLLDLRTALRGGQFDNQRLLGASSWMN